MFNYSLFLIFFKLFLVLVLLFATVRYFLPFYFVMSSYFDSPRLRNIFWRLATYVSTSHWMIDYDLAFSI